MTLVSVRVKKPQNRLIYINGDYVEPAGNSSTDSFTVPTGGNVFETLNGSHHVDNRKRIRVRPIDHEREIELDSVDPPEPI